MGQPAVGTAVQAGRDLRAAQALNRMEGPQTKSLACFYSWPGPPSVGGLVVCFAGTRDRGPQSSQRATRAPNGASGPCAWAPRNRTDGARRQTGIRVAGPSPLPQLSAVRCAALPAAPCPSFYPNYGARLAGPGLLGGGDSRLSGPGPYIPRRSWPLLELWELSCITTDFLTKPKSVRTFPSLHWIVLW